MYKKLLDNKDKKIKRNLEKKEGKRITNKHHKKSNKKHHLLKTKSIWNQMQLHKKIKNIKIQKSIDIHNKIYMDIMWMILINQSIENL